jgi:hypothetical protein
VLTGVLIMGVYMSPSRYLCLALSFVLVAGAYRPALGFCEWNNTGSQSITCGSPSVVEFPTYVAPRQIILFNYRNLVDIDTCVAPKCDCPENDPNREARLKKVGGTFVQEWTSPTFADLAVEAIVPYTVPADAGVGKTIRLQAQIHDTRAGTDARHDDWVNVGPEFEFTVTTTLPNAMWVEDTDDESGNLPSAAGHTYGKYRFQMKVSGNLPQDRNNWNGTLVTEHCGNVVGSEEDFVDNVVGQPIGGESSFTVGTAGDDCFYDWTISNASFIILEQGVQEAFLSWGQTYFFQHPSGEGQNDGVGKEFDNTGSAGLLANPARVKVDWAKDPD